MTKRKPLQWFDTEFGLTPDCYDCMDKLHEPMFLEACASVAIEHPTSTGGLAKRFLDRWHANRHRDTGEPVVLGR